MRMRRFAVSAVALVFASAGMFVLAANPNKSKFFNLGNGWAGSDVSATGGYAAGTADNGNCFVWTEATGITMTSTEGPNCAISDLGAEVAGTANFGGKTTASYSVDGGGSFQTIATPPNWSGCGASRFNTYDMTADGQTIVGLGWPDCRNADAYKWDAIDGFVQLDDSAQENPARATRANFAGADENCIVGWADSPFGFRQGAIWRDGVMELVFDEDGQRLGEAQGASPDCSYVVGTGNGQLAWMMNPDGSLTRMGLGGVDNENPGTKIPKTDIAVAVTTDGSRVIGFNLNNNDGTRVAWIWHASDGKTIELRKFLHTNGANDVHFWKDLQVAASMSDDGTLTAGFGLDQYGAPTGFIATMPAP